MATWIVPMVRMRRAATRLVCRMSLRVAMASVRRCCGAAMETTIAATARTSRKLCVRVWAARRENSVATTSYAFRRPKCVTVTVTAKMDRMRSLPSAK